jgi:biopolymer transport protein ExbD
MMKRLKRSRQSEAELDITSFMNLMIILVPVLLMSMAFSHITVLDLRLPDAAGAGGDQSESKQLELVIRSDYIDVNYPPGVRLKRIANQADDYDFALVSTVLQEVKRQLRDRGIEKRDILILAQQDTDYQTLVGAMDTVRFFEAVVAASVVRAQLFPDIALGDAPVEASDEAPLLAQEEQP